MLAARDAKFRAKLNALLAEKRGQIAEFIEYFYKRAGVVAPVPPAARAMGFRARVVGRNLALLSSPGDGPAGTAESVLSLFIDSIMQMARLQGRA